MNKLTVIILLATAIVIIITPNLIFLMQEFQFWLYHAIEWAWSFVLVDDPSHRLYWFYLLMFATIASCIYLIRKPATTNLIGFILPLRILFNRSSITDIKIYLINSVLGTIINLATFFASIAIVAETVAHFLEFLFGAIAEQSSPNYLITSLFGIAFLLLSDFAVFLAHYLHHKIPALWSFHKTHHSAEVLTPVTAFRFHPVELVISGLMLAFLVGPLVGTFQYLFDPNLFSGNPKIFGIVMLLWLITANFRHSHIPIHYPMILSRWLVSPVMHNIHHSTQRKHFDKNFGLFFSFWDRIAGTWYFPENSERLNFGIGDDKTFQSATGCYLTPLKENSARFKALFMRLTSRRRTTEGHSVESSQPSAPHDD